MEAFALFGPVADAPSLLRAYWWRRESNPVRAGMELAVRHGCVSCHGPGGARGVVNPGALTPVPTFEGGSAMMVPRAEVRAYVTEYIRDGIPSRLKSQPGYAAEAAKALIGMPAYGDILSGAEIEALAEYVIAAAGLLGPSATAADPAEARAARGRQLAREKGCFACHGPDGAGGVRNPGSFKGYIPGFAGDDFAALVRDDGELRAWIQDGGIPRLAEDDLAQRFIRRQKIQMPPFRRALASDEVDAIVAYIRWLRARRAS